MSQPATPCCHYVSSTDYPVKWNEANKVVQCHNCGAIYDPESPQVVNPIRMVTEVDIANLVKKLKEAGSVGLDLSPGDPLCAEAAKLIEAMCGIIAVNDIKMSTSDVRDLYSWCLGMLTENRQPRSRYFQVIDVLEWYTKMDNVVLQQQNKIKALESAISRN